MKRIVSLLPVLCMTFASPAFALMLPTETVRDTEVDRYPAESEAEAAAPRPAKRTAEFAISTFNEETVKAFANAWARSNNGTTPQEGVVLIYKMIDGTFQPRSLAASNEYKSRSFPWHPGIIAIIHTHPNQSQARPQAEDIVAAERFMVPVFTITNRGMYAYDPYLKKTLTVKNGLDWLNPAKWLGAAAQAPQTAKLSTR